MRRIKLTRGLVALIDDADYTAISKYRWHATGERSWGCVYAHNSKVGRMHRFLMNPPQGFEIDHINGSGLDNRRANLRICTPQENVANSGRDGHCRNGHLMTVENCRQELNGDRRCRICKTKNDFRVYWRNPEKARQRSMNYRKRKRGSK